MPNKSNRKMLDEFPDEILINIFSHLKKRDLCKCSQVNKRWNFLTYCKVLWTQFSLTDIVKPKWCASKLVSIENTSYLIQKRFGHNITRVDLAKLCFSFETLDTLFQNCSQIKSLVINFKYYTCQKKYLVDQCIHTWPVNKIEKLYLKNVKLEVGESQPWTLDEPPKLRLDSLVSILGVDKKLFLEF